MLWRRSVLCAVFLLVTAGCAGTVPVGPETTPATTTSTVVETTAFVTTTVMTSTTATAQPLPTTLVTTTTTVPVGELLVLGDFGSGRDSEYAAADAMLRWAESHSVAAILTTGDNLYIDDVGKAWTEPFGWVADAGIPVWATWGNHDHERPGVVDDAFGDPPRWTSHRWGDVTVLILDSTRIDHPDQEAWLRQALGEAAGPVIVAEHHPALSCSSHGDTASVLDRWTPLFERAGVDLVLAGHDHNYQRFEDDGVTYMVTGGGGAGLYDLKDCPKRHPPRIAGDAAHHFLVLSQEADGVRVQVVDVDGEMIDEFFVADR